MSPLLQELHWLSVPERIKYQLAVLVFRCGHDMAPEYLARDLQWAANTESRQRLRSSSSQQLIVPRTRLFTVGDRAFGAAAARIWNSLTSTVHRLSDIARYWSKIAVLTYPTSTCPPPLGMTPLEFRQGLWRQKTRRIALSYGVKYRR